MAKSSTLPDSPLADVPPEQRPRHIAIIMDGNGRWAQRQGLPRIEGHRRGVESVRRTTEECVRLGIGSLTLYCLSSENWKRPQQELDFLMRLLVQYLIEERKTIQDNKIRLSMIGRRDGLPADVLEELDRAIAMSRDNTGMQLCLAINYGARAELVDAVQKLCMAVARGQIASGDIDERLIAENLYTAHLPDPDLVIRTAGELRLSNFLLWQISYAELWVTTKCWPEFREPDLHAAVRSFAERDRRYGGLND